MTSKHNKTTKPRKPAKSVAKAQMADTIKSEATKGGERFYLPLKNLIPDPKNVRRYVSDAELGSLKALIVTHDVLQNLVVRPGPKGKFFVTTGSRRLRALKELQKEGASVNKNNLKVTGEYPVPVMLLSKEENATEVSLAENVGRLNMHAADEVEAVRILHEVDGMTPEQIGDRFGKSHQTIRRRLKLAKVSAKIMDAFRAGEATLDQLEALAVSDDHAAQEKAFFCLPDWSRNPSQIRAALTSEKIRGDHRLVSFIGLSAYEAAGGTITRNLFTEDDQCYLDDKPLVMQLVAEKLGEAAKGVEAEGWKWVEFYASDKDSGGSLPVIPSFQREHTEAESAEVAEIMAYIEANEPAYDNGDMSEAEIAAYEGKSARMDEIDALCIGYNPELVAMAGARLILDHAGEINVRRGLLKKEDQHERAAQERRVAAEAAEADALTRGEVYTPEPPAVSESEEGAGLSAAVVEDLTKTRTAALAVELAKRPDVALAVLVHALALPLMYGNIGGYGLTPAVAIRPTPAPVNISVGDADNTAPFEAWEKLGAYWSAILPDSSPKLWTWCMEAKPDQLQKLMAYLVAATTNAVQFRQESAGYAANRLAHADLLAEAVHLDMANWWKPSADFFRRAPKAVAAQALTEAGGSPTVSAAMLKGSKAEAIETVLTGLGSRRWLPAPLRTRPSPEAVSQGEEDDKDRTGDAPDVSSNEESGADAENGLGDRHDFADDSYDEARALESVYGPDEA